MCLCGSELEERVAGETAARALVPVDMVEMVMMAQSVPGREPLKERDFRMWIQDGSRLAQSMFHCGREMVARVLVTARRRAEELPVEWGSMVLRF
jgi:hypothetical protein